MTTLTLYATSLGQAFRQIDRAVLVILALILAMALLMPLSAVGESLNFTLTNLIGIAPYLLASAVAAAWLTAAGADGVISRVFQGHWLVVIGAAALFGSLSPFCSCGVIPIIAALLAAGVPLPAVMAFWLSSPIMDPEIFLITVGAIGLQFAIAKTIAAFLIGIFGGLGTHMVQAAGGFAAPLREQVSSGGTCRPSIPDAKIHWSFWKTPERLDKFRTTVIWTVLFLGKWLVLAFILESLMVRYVPPELIGGWLGNDSSWALPLAVITGVPAYLNGYVAIPLVAGLMDSGMAPGPALAFMTAGAVTSIPAAIAVYALVRKAVFLWYILLAVVGSLLAGGAYQIYTTGLG